MAATPRKRRGNGKTSVHVLLPDEMARTLGAYAEWNRLDRSEVVCEALKPVLKGFRVTHLGHPAEKGGEG